ncbi:hypothetical protein BV20DRAFT_1120085 [Pilatotrama ljubarskyi]|nr:hypothetical protein BV20DRAFT_1120085 [Pilatotrama ljubarskyi]
MQSFSRIIARPVLNGRPGSNGAAKTPEGLPPLIAGVSASLYDPRATGNPLADPRIKALWEVDGMVTQGRTELFEPYKYGSFGHQYIPVLSRTDSVGSLPSLCADDGSSDSVLSWTPPPPALESPPPTGCSNMAVIGSPPCMDCFECERPEAHPLWIHQQLEDSWYLRRQARMRDGDYRDTDNEEDFYLVDERIVPNAPLLATRPLPDVYDAPAVFFPPPSPPKASADLTTDQRVSAWIAKARFGVKRSRRLSERVRTPPPLNVSAIRAHTLLTKLLRGSYDVEVRDVDGSEILDESGFEADDEDGYDSPEEASHAPPRAQRAKVPKHSGHVLPAGKENVPPKQVPPARKSYAAVAASTRMPGAAPSGDGKKAGLDSTPMVRVREAKDWTNMFERRGPSLEV